MTVRASNSARTRRRAGFSLLELLIAGVIFSLGMLALAYAYGQGLAFVMSSGEETVARQKARETMESVFTALNTQHLNYSSLCNVSQGDGCIFLDGMTPLYQAGADGIYGTSDDASAGLQTVITPGPDGMLGTADDITTQLREYERQIQISDLSTTLKQVQVSIRYTTTRNMVRTIQLTTYVSAYN